MDINSLVSIIIACYNQEKYLAETLESVSRQTHSSWECIIVDDGSTDDSKDIAIKYSLRDSRFSYIYKQNGGPSESRNWGIKNSHGEYLLPLDADDLISEEYLSDALNAFKQHPNARLVYANADFIGNKSGQWNLKEYKFQDLLFGNMIHCSAMFKRKDYDQTLGYKNNMLFGLEDWDYWLSLLDQNSEVIHLPQILFHYRIKFNSRTILLNKDRKKKYKKMKLQIYINNLEKYDSPINVMMLINIAYFLSKQLYQIKKNVRNIPRIFK